MHLTWQNQQYYIEIHPNQDYLTNSIYQQKYAKSLPKRIQNSLVVTFPPVSGHPRLGLLRSYVFAFTPTHLQSHMYYLSVP